MIITIDMDKFLQALKIEGTDEYREAFISVGEFQKALKIAEVKQSGWISVEERLPETYDECLLLLDNELITIGWYHASAMEFVEGGMVLVNKVTHWMPIPEAPKGEKNG